MDDHKTQLVLSKVATSQSRILHYLSYVIERPFISAIILSKTTIVFMLEFTPSVTTPYTMIFPEDNISSRFPVIRQSTKASKGNQQIDFWLRQHVLECMVVS